MLDEQNRLEREHQFSDQRTRLRLVIAFTGSQALLQSFREDLQSRFLGPTKLVAKHLAYIRRALHRAQNVKAHDIAGAFPDRIEDRKSTRLNSSHMSISYAVFCLKKKIDAR